MTQREFLSAVIEANLTEELTEYATEAVQKLDKLNEKRREASAKKATVKETERAPKREALMECITKEPKTATTLIAESGLDITPQAVSSLLKSFIENGTIIKASVKVSGKGKQVGYAFPEVTE